MADSDDLTPMTNADIVPPPATQALQPAEPVVVEQPGDAVLPATTEAQAKQSARETVSGFGQQAGDRARELAEAGKEKVGGLLDQFAQMLTDAAAQVDDKLGAQYGDHARGAATTVQGFAQTVRDKDVDEFAGEVRGYVAKSPGVALGVAAALGFGLARVVHAGFDQRV